jgi:hypothetical protein
MKTLLLMTTLLFATLPGTARIMWDRDGTALFEESSLVAIIHVTELNAKPVPAGAEYQFRFDKSRALKGSLGRSNVLQVLDSRAFEPLAPLRRPAYALLFLQTNEAVFNFTSDSLNQKVIYFQTETPLDRFSMLEDLAKEMITSRDPSTRLNGVMISAGLTNATVLSEARKLVSSSDAREARYAKRVLKAAEERQHSPGRTR